MILISVKMKLMSLNIYDGNENEDYGGLNDHKQNNFEVYVKGDVYEVNDNEYDENAMDDYDANEIEHEDFWEDDIPGYWQDDLEATELFDDLAYDVDIYDFKTCNIFKEIKAGGESEKEQRPAQLCACAQRTC